MVAKALTAESTGEQGRAGLTDCTPAEFAHIQALNAAYNARFGWPFILAVRGPRGAGLTRQEIIASFERRLAGHPDDEFAEAPAQHPPHRRDPPRRQVRRDPGAGRSGLGLGRGARRRQRSRLPRAGRAHRHLPHRGAPLLRASDSGLDAGGGLRRNARRRGRQRRRRLPRRGPRGAAPAHRQPLRHRAQRRPVRRPSGHPGADRLRARARPRGPAPARTGSRSSRSPRRRGSATRPRSSGPARWSGASTPRGSTRSTPTA